MSRHLTLRLDAPLMSFGGDMVDAYGVVRDFPAKSMVTGLIANALGWERYQTSLMDRLQERLVMGAIQLRAGRRIQDFQTAQLGSGDRGWTTHGRVEGRAGGAGTYQSPHIRYRDADADAVMMIAFRLVPTDETPDLDDIGEALDRPERPLFIGRKPFLPATPLRGNLVEADDIREALILAAADAQEPRLRAQWPIGEGADEGAQLVELTDERNWLTGVHAGLRRVVEGHIRVGAA